MLAGDPLGRAALAASADEERGRLVKHAHYDWLLLAEGHLNRKLFGDMPARLAALPAPGG